MFFKLSRNSLYFKISAWYFISIGLLLFLVSMAIYYFTSTYTWQALDERLLADAENVSEVIEKMYSEIGGFPRGLRHKHLKEGFNKWIEKKNAEASFFNKFIVIANSQKRFLAVSKKIPEPDVFLRNLQVDFEAGDYTYYSFRQKPQFSMRIITYPFFEKNRVKFYLQIGASSFKEDQFLRRLRNGLVIVFPLVFLLSILGMYFLRRMLEPLYNLINHMQAVEVDLLDTKLPEAFGSDELTILIKDYNAMLLRLKDSFAKLKQIGVNISHQLRTPLTILQGEVETILARERQPEEYRETLQSNLDEIRKMIGTIEKLLLLGNLKSGTYLKSKEKLSLNELIFSLLKRFQSQIKRNNLLIDFVPEDDFSIEADLFLLENLMQNLIGNAVQYSAQNSTIVVRLQAFGKKVVCEIINLPRNPLPADVNLLFDRYYSSRPSKMSGGLGLSIAAEIVEMCQGKIMTSLNRDKKLIMRIELPSL